MFSPAIHHNAQRPRRWKRRKGTNQQDEKPFSHKAHGFGKLARAASQRRPGVRKNGTSAPANSAASFSRAASRGWPQASFSQSRKAAASPLPPPSPASLGMPLRKVARIPKFGRQKAPKACQAREKWCFSGRISGSSQTISRPGTGSFSNSSSSRG